MKRKTLKSITIMLSVCLFALSLVACNLDRNNQNQLNNGGTEQRYNLQRQNVMPGTPQPVPGGRLNNTASPSPAATAFDTQRAQTIKSSLKDMRGVTDANVIVMGNTAVVGYKPVSNARSIGTTKDAIVNKVKQTDKSITNVYVSQTAGVANRIGKLVNDIANNASGNQLRRDFTKIIKSINPMP